MKKIGLILMFFWLTPMLISGQETFEVSRTMSIKGSVKEKSTRKPIKGAEITIAGKGTVTTDVFGDFKVEARVGDELIITDDGFTTVRYTIKDGQNIDVLVEDHPNEPQLIKKRAGQKLESNYTQNLEAARNTLKKDAATSIEYITNALESVRDDDPAADNKKAELFEALADIYKHWKQPDLAESNYLISLKNKYNADVEIKLGYSRLEAKNYQTAFNTFSKLQKSRLSATQKIQVYEGLGDSYKGLQRYSEAITSYNKALSLSQRKKQEGKVISLNSKLAKVLQQQGQLSAAEGYLDNSVQLAQKKDKKTSARQRTVAADFYNKSNSYAKEIQLRKEALQDIEEIEQSEGEAPLNEDKSLTPQVQNYKIASAFAAQQEYDEAITYLEESKKEAKSKNDLIVQKDAARKLGEVYREKGELKKASEAFEEYEVIIDKLYIQKDQEISQAARFSRELAQKANRITTLEKDRELNETRYELAFASQELANQQSLRQQIVIYFLVGLTILLLLAAYLMFRNMKQQRYANNLLALKSLRSQMNPHFIFNALNSVNTFIATNDERTANRYLTDFSLLMRAVLENSEQDFIPLEKEIELLKLYVQLEHFRFQDKFDYTIEVDPEINVNEYMIPPMLLQPYVENAVWHGLRYKSEKGILSINFQNVASDTIEIIITDNGIGRKKSKELKTQNQKLQKSKGMGNIRKRIAILNKMYKDKVDVFITDLEENSEGTKVKLTLNKDK
ncbi:histidine kinase [Aquimarina mytili]|uniref:Histidine kinase n=1 Tax=Aquimarina mytili TaxID=874423 RepID=A0A937D819_9FLAO|nr:histidine kinase [Aquimarina mytili]MBL0683650.1 histidine kinase [Aquimarina mytili]